MKAVALFATTREVRLIEHEPPVVRTPAEVRLRVLDVGVCGTDVELCEFRRISPPPGDEYLVLGHECVGEVVEVGSAVTGVRVGDLVVPMVRHPCPHEHCTACRSGHQDFCFTSDYAERGIKDAHGCMTEYVVDEERYMVPITPELRDVAVLVEPLTIAEKSIAQFRRIQQRLPWVRAAEATGESGYCRTAVVLGAGPIGLLAAAALVVQGFDTYVYSRGAPTTPKAVLAEALGATYVCSATDPVERLVKRTGDIDFVYEATGGAPIALEVLQALGPNGVFVVASAPHEQARIEMPARPLLRAMILKNQVVLGTVNAGHEDFDRAIRDLGLILQRRPDALRSLITARHSIEAYRELLLDDPGGVKHVITMAGAA